MKSNLNLSAGESGMEVTLNPNDLRVCMVSSIYERNSTAGYEEVPEINQAAGRTVTNRMIQADQPWGVTVNWQVNGIFANLLGCGHWKTKVIFELMGGGENAFSPEMTTEDAGCPGQRYTSQVDIRPGQLRPGVYRVITCLQYCLENGNPGPIAGFIDNGLVKVYQDHKAKRTTTATNGVSAAVLQ